jgi:hypothetical protein
MARAVKYEINGRIALERRMRGDCIQCGINKTPQDSKTGFPAFLCAPCQARNDASAALTRKVKA